MSKSLFSACPRKVRIVEVGPRDGLQNEKAILPTAEKVAWIRALAAAGHTHIEVASFVNPERVPQMADAEAVFAAIERKPGVRYTALVPNEKGFDRALKAGATSMALFTAASETFSRKNSGMSVPQSIESVRLLAKRAQSHKIALRAYVSTAFVCPYEGQVPLDAPVRAVAELRSMGVHEISVADTLGAAFPRHVSELLEALHRRLGSLSGIALHAHDTFHRGAANILVGLLHGVEEIDASTAGLGGCPFAPGARGNISTEETVELLTGMGVETGIDADLEREASRLILDAIKRASTHA